MKAIEGLGGGATLADTNDVVKVTGKKKKQKAGKDSSPV